mgnify:CR=1 FL=1
MASPEEQAKGWGCLIVCAFIVLCGFLSGKQHNSSSSYSSGSSTSTSNTWAGRHYQEQLKKQQQEEYNRKQLEQTIQRMQSQLVYSGHSGSPRSNYQQLWDECEDLEAALNDAGIDHEDLSYPMDFHDLEDLRDEYQSLLEGNDVDY